MKQTSPLQLEHQDQPGALADQEQEDKERLEEDFVVQIAKRAKEEWETFHLEHPDIDEETFRQAQRFCVKPLIPTKRERGLARREKEGIILAI